MLTVLGNPLMAVNHVAQRDPNRDNNVIAGNSEQMPEALARWPSIVPYNIATGDERNKIH